MMGGTAIALTSIRILSYGILGYGLFYLAMHFSDWYELHILDDELEYIIGDDITVRSSYNQRFLFIAVPIVLAAALGGVYEAVWKRREILASKVGREARNGGQPEVEQRPEVLAMLHGVMHLKFRPLGQYAPWVTVGEAIALSVWCVAMGIQIWQGVASKDYYERYSPCEDDPSKWCSERSGEVGPSFDQYRLRTIAIYMGFMCSSHFAIILVPVSRDSKIWSAIGVPFERAVLYHAVAGHLAFATIFIHAFLFVAYWVWTEGWRHAVRESIHVEAGGGSVDIPMGWMAALCALPMWIASTNYVRRRWYSLFKLSHWLFIGLFVFGSMHWAPNTLYFMGGLALYTVHVMSRLEAWKRWRYWNRWLSPSTKASPTSLVNALTTGDYTRLVLRNPKVQSARGGSFVYLSVPAALGTDEGHAITVALRGAPPSSVPEKARDFPEEDVFTVYVKDLGPWTKALRVVSDGPAATASPQSLLVDVDGFYNNVESLGSMMKGGASRVVVVAGGSGVTSLMGFIQDWCVAASEGVAVPEVHLIWCCRYMAEMELVGETLPSMLSKAGEAKNTHFTMTLYCSKPDSKNGALSVTWPLDNMAYAKSTTREHVIGEDYIASSLNYSVRIIIAGLAAYGGFILAVYELDRRLLDNTFHEGGITLVLILVCMVSSLVVYDWLCYLVRRIRDPGHSKVGRRMADESKVDLESSSMGGSATYDVQRGRVPTKTILTQESDMAEKKGLRSVKVLTSGPNSLVDMVLSDARAINWKLFDTEAFSFEF